jgi:glycosyltransferase involved in cell wall biosynthesis
MERKKLLFMLANMNIGGTEKAFLNMIGEVSKEKYEITLLLLEKYGGLLEFIPDWVSVEYVSDYIKFKDIINKPPKQNIINLVRERNYLEVLIYMIIYFITKFQGERSMLYKYITKSMPILEKSYDVAVAYAGPLDFISYFVCYKVNAKKKIQWVHFDITKIGFNNKFAKKTYKYFTRIFVVSSEAREKLVKSLPHLKDRTEVFNNVISPSVILEQTNIGVGFQDDFHGLRILTVGRLSYEKGQDLAIKIMAKLKELGYPVRWYCIGDGNMRHEYERMIREYELDDSFILLGSTTNPYPYVQQCDIYVQPSRYEGYCITVMEAKCLKKPIITTNVNGANEQIKNEETGIIVSFEENSLLNSVKRLIEDVELRTKFSKNLYSEYIDTSSEIKKLYKLIG